MLELHCAHGYLLCELYLAAENERTDEYGGSLENRLRYPFEVFAAVRAQWPKRKPMSIRISASDWAPRWHQPRTVCKCARCSKHGAAIIDVSAGMTSRRAKPVYGRMFQTPFSE